MSEPYVVDGHASLVESVTEFSLLRKLVEHDSKGGLFARKVCVECSLVDQPYEEVAAVLAKISKSQICYSFPKAVSHTIRSNEDWNSIKAVVNTAIGVENYFFNELTVDKGAFDEMKTFLKNAGGLLIDLNRISQGASQNLRAGPAIH